MNRLGGGFFSSTFGFSDISCHGIVVSWSMPDNKQCSCFFQLGVPQKSPSHPPCCAPHCSSHRTDFCAAGHVPPARSVPFLLCMCTWFFFHRNTGFTFSGDTHELFSIVREYGCYVARWFSQELANSTAKCPWLRDPERAAQRAILCIRRQ